jgi:hypothetical protein
MPVNTTLAEDRSARAIQALAPGVAYDIAFGSGASTAGQSIAAGTSVVRLCPTVDCRVALAPSAAATATSLYLPAFAVEYLRVPAEAGTCAVAAWGVSGAGSLSVCEMK